MTCTQPTSDRLGRSVACRQQSSQQVQLQWLNRLAFGPDREADALVQLWLGIFPVSWRVLREPSLLERQAAAIRRCLSGSYVDMLQAMVTDAAMQISLNGLQNRRGNPNENFARELLELFSVGLGHYNERDVSEAARALTGYRLDAEGRLMLVPKMHDDGTKTILGRRASFDAGSLVTWLCEQPATARHVITRLWLNLVGSPPLPDRLTALARGWRQQQLALPWLIQQIRFSPEAAAARGQRCDSPISMVVRSLELLGSRHPDALAISLYNLGRMGQAPFEPPSVKGWPVNTEWISLRWLQARRRGLLALLAHEEIWASRRPLDVLPASITPVPPLTITLPTPGTRENLSVLFTDPVWQLS
jgi:uncharacterized protein (DUF1800 family)